MVDGGQEFRTEVERKGWQKNSDIRRR